MSWDECDSECGHRRIDYLNIHNCGAFAALGALEGQIMKK